MIKIIIDLAKTNGKQVDVSTEHEDGKATGVTKDELRILKSIADEYCCKCKEGAE